MGTVSGRIRRLGVVALCALLLTIVAAGAGAHGDTSRASLSSTGGQGNDDSFLPAVSGNGNLVVFSSAASNLVAGDTNGVLDIFLRDRAAGTTKRVSLDPSGAQFNLASSEPAVSFDGSTVAWVTGDQVYVRDLATGATQLVSKSPSLAPGNGISHVPELSASGRYVAYWSGASNLVGGADPVGTADIFVYDRVTSTTELVSVDSTEASAAVGNDSLLAAISGDGRYVAFETRAAFDPADTNGVFDVYLRDRTAGTTTLVSHDAAGAAANATSYEGDSGPSISSDGSRIAFASTASNLVAGDGNGSVDVFVYSVPTGAIERASVLTGGADAPGDSVRPSLNADGTLVAFQSSAVLQSWDTNTDTDVYVRHLAETPKRTTLESVSSQGQSVSGGKFVPALNGDATIVVYYSLASSIVSGDTNGRYDVFVHELGIADVTLPTVTGTAASSPNADGWYNTNVVVNWAASDPEPSSGQPVAPPATTASTEGKSVTYTSGPACDGNGNCATGTIKLSIDKTAPTLVATRNSANSFGWNNSDVVVGYTCTDAVSGVASCPAAVKITTQGLAAPVVGVVTDRAGNTTTSTTSGIKIDLTAPTIAYSGATSYDVDDVVSITCSASDALSGIASTTCANVAGPAYLFAAGSHSLSATATDKAGNDAAESFAFTITPTVGGLQTLACSFLGTGKKYEQFCKKLTRDLDDAVAYAAAGDIKHRDLAIRKFLGTASKEVGKLITTQQMLVLTQVADAITS